MGTAKREQWFLIDGHGDLIRTWAERPTPVMVEAAIDNIEGAEIAP